MKLNIFNSCIEIANVMSIDEHGCSIVMNENDETLIKWRKEEDKYFRTTGHAPTYTALFDSYPVIYDDLRDDELSYEYPSDANVLGNITNIMRPIIETLQEYIDKCENGELEDASCYNDIEALWLERLSLDTDDWTITPCFGS